MFTCAKKIIAVLAMAIMVVGCSTASKKEQTQKSLAEDAAQASQVRHKTAAEERHRTQLSMESTLAAVPDWALAHPKPDATGVYAVGIAESDVMRIAIRKAFLEAEFELAKSYGQEISGSERSFSQDNNGEVAKEQFTGLIDKLVASVPVVGYEVVRQEVKPIDGKYNAFVLLKLPHKQFNQVLQNQRASTQNVEVKKAFDELERRLIQRQQQLAKDGGTANQPASIRPLTVNAHTPPPPPVMPQSELPAPPSISTSIFAPLVDVAPAPAANSVSNEPLPAADTQTQAAAASTSEPKEKSWWKSIF